MLSKMYSHAATICLRSLCPVRFMFHARACVQVVRLIFASAEKNRQGKHITHATHWVRLGIWILKPRSGLLQVTLMRILSHLDPRGTVHWWGKWFGACTVGVTVVLVRSHVWCKTPDESSKPAVTKYDAVWSSSVTIEHIAMLQHCSTCLIGEYKYTIIVIWIWIWANRESHLW